MKLIEVMGIAIGVVNLIVIPWGVWVTKSLYNLSADLKLNDQKDEEIKALTQKVSDSLKSIYEELEDIKLALAEKQIRVRK